MNEADKKAFNKACKDWMVKSAGKDLGEYFWKAGLNHARSGDAVAWQFKDETDRWNNGSNSIKDHRESTEKAGYEIRELFAHSQPAGAQDPIYIVGEGWQCDEMPPAGTGLYTQATAVAQVEHLSQREIDVLRFALQRFWSNAYLHMNAAAQDKEGKRYPFGAVNKFHEDAKITETLLKRFDRDATTEAPAADVVNEQLLEALKGLMHEDGGSLGYAPSNPKCKAAMAAIAAIAKATGESN